MHAFGQSGVDVYLNGIYRGSQVAGQDAKPGKIHQLQYFDLAGEPKVLRDVTLRRKHPQTPIVAITPIAAVFDLPGGPPPVPLEAMRELIRMVVARRIAYGDRNIQVVEGTDLLDLGCLDGLVDGLHPNDLGFQWIAEELARRLGKLLDVRAASQNR